MKKLYLVDVSAMFFRAYYAIRPLTSPHGLPTNALFGFLSMTVKLLRDHKPEHMVFCFDRKEPSFRADLYPEYKANRSEMPEDLVPQIPYIKKLTTALGISQCESPGFEADDVIGTLAKWGEAQGLEVVIISGDKDFAQLINSKITMLDTMKDRHYTEAEALEKWGVKPDQMIDYLALVGDSSDNIPGVKGVGPKGAQKLLNEFNTLAGIYEGVEQIKSASIKKKLIENKEMAFLSQDLVTIRTSVELDFNLESYRLAGVERERLAELLDELGFKSFEKGLLGKPSSSGEKPGTESKKGDSVKPQKNPTGKGAAKVLTKARKSSIKTLSEVEWSAEDFVNNIEPYEELWVDFNERGLFFSCKGLVITTQESPMKLGALLKEKLLLWQGFDLKEAWRQLGIQVATAAWDSMLAAYVVRAGSVPRFPQVYEETLGLKFPDLPSPAEVFQCHMELKAHLEKQVDEKGGREVLNKIELPLVPVLRQMEHHGILLDVKLVQAQSVELKKQIQSIEEKIHEHAGEKFNVASPKQLGVILFEKLELPKGKKTKTGYSTGSDVLAKLTDLHPIISLVSEFRELSKLVSTYLDALPQLVDEETHRLHTHFRQAHTSTGRLSSVNPNLQNIPIRTTEGRKIREAFISPKGHKLISADYSQIELRILAHITNDKGLVTAFQNDQDIHSATAAEIFSVEQEQVTSEQRRMAKAVNFGIAYGQGVYGLAEALGIPRGESKEIIGRYFEKFPGVREYMDDTIERAKSQGFVETIFGRRRYLDELKATNRNVQAFGERAAINAPIQGAASDIVKKAMILLYEDLSIPMLLQVHDELIFECPDDEVEEHSARIKDLMESVVQLSVPLKINICSGESWSEAH